MARSRQRRATTSAVRRAQPGGAHQRGAGGLVVADPARAEGGADIRDHYTVLHVNQA
jgi:hypothetical protein